MTRTEFDSLLTNVYTSAGSLTGLLTYAGNSVSVFASPEKTNALFTLRFAVGHPPSIRPTIALRRIALDPGHIGGEWARMEERFFVRGKDRPVQEAVLNLTVAQLLKQRLDRHGCNVFLTKNDLQPVTDKRPEDFRVAAQQAVAQLKTYDAYPPLERDAALADAVRKGQEQLFYRGAEIAARAKLVNDWYRPDLTVCIHFNAVEWNDRFDLVDDNRILVFVHGRYLPEELADDSMKMRLFFKLLSRTIAVELPVAESVANALARATKLPPGAYGPSGPAIRVGTNAYVYARNLAANRLIDSPVIFLEPYYMNNRVVYQRIQLGDYDGVKEINGNSYPSIFREYADAVFEGLLPYLDTTSH